MLECLSVLSEVQTVIGGLTVWPSWCHCHSLSLATVKSRLVLPFWYWLTRVVSDKGPLNGCVCMCVIFDRVIQKVDIFDTVYRKNSIVVCTIFTIITPLKVGVCVIHVNWSACQFSRNDKCDQSSTWRSFFCKVWHFVMLSCRPVKLLDADSGQTSGFNCSTGPLKVLGTGMTVSCSPLLSHHSPGRENDCMHRQRSRDVRTRTFPWTHIAAHRCMHLRTRRQTWTKWTRLQTHADASVNASANLYLVSAVDVNATLH